MSEQLRADLSRRLGLRTDEAASLLGVSTETIVAWCRSGQLPAVRYGRTWLISPDALRARFAQLSPWTASAATMAPDTGYRPP